MNTSDLRVQRTRKAIDDAFWELMKKKDFEEITINDVSELACINRVTFYHHYVDKYNWLEAMIEKMFAEYETLIDAIYLEKSENALEDSLQGIVPFLEKHYILFSILLHNKGTDFFQSRYKKMMLDILRRSSNIQISNSNQTDFWINYIASAVVGSYEWWVQNNRPISAEEMVRNLHFVYKTIITERILI